MIGFAIAGALMTVEYILSGERERIFMTCAEAYKE